MTYNIGEEIVGQYLRISRKCTFIDYNPYTVDVQGEIDVVGIDTINKHVFVCEVAIHTRGLNYGRHGTYDTFRNKFEKCIAYSDNKFDSYIKTYMLWSPVVKPAKVKELEKLKKALKRKHSINLELVINRQFKNCFEELKEHVADQENTKEFKSPVLRLLQIEYKLSQLI